MKINKFLAAAALMALGTTASFAAGTYSYGDIVATFDNPTGNDLEIDLGAITTLPASGTEDFGNVSSLLSSAGQTVSSTFFAVASVVNDNSIKGGATSTLNTGLGTLTVLPATLAISQNNGATPSFVGSPSATAVASSNYINNVGADIADNAAVGTTGLSATAVIVSASGDPLSFSNQGNYGETSLNLETTGAGTLQLWVLTSQSPGTAGKSGTNEGPITGAYDIGTFTLSSTGELTYTAFTAVPEPSTYAAILGALTLGVVAIRRRKAAVL